MIYFFKNKLVKYCQERVKQLSEKDEMIKRTNEKYGENISSMWSSDPEHTVCAEEIVSRWYAEHEHYNYSEEPKDLNAGELLSPPKLNKYRTILSHKH